MSSEANHYVNNRQLHEALTEYIKQVKLADAEQRERPRIPDYVASCILAICARLALKPIFANYPFVEEMKSDGIQNSIEYLHNYDPERYQNPFAYLTQIAYWAFVRRIQKEKKYLYTKLKVTQHSMILYDEDIDTEDQSVKNQISVLTEWADEFTRDYEATLQRAKAAKGKGEKTVIESALLLD